MEIIRVLNNNAILTTDSRGEDIIVLGSGIAFHKKRGEIIDDAKVERTFYQDDNDIMGKLKKVLQRYLWNTLIFPNRSYQKQS